MTQQDRNRGKAEGQNRQAAGSQRGLREGREGRGQAQEERGLRKGREQTAQERATAESNTRKDVEDFEEQRQEGSRSLQRDQQQRPR